MILRYVLDNVITTLFPIVVMFSTEKHLNYVGFTHVKNAYLVRFSKNTKVWLKIS